MAASSIDDGFATLQMITFDRVGCETVPVQVEVTSVAPPCTTAKEIIAAASKKFKTVNKQSRVYNGISGNELQGTVELSSLGDAYVVVSGKAGWKGAARLSAGYESMQTQQAGQRPAASSTASASNSTVKCNWDGVCRGRVGLDVGGVLNQHNNDQSSADSKEWWLKLSSEAPDAIESVRRLVELFGPDNVYVISKVGADMQRLTETWLHDVMNICGQTGLRAENIHFCRKRSGRDGKGPLAARLQLSHFVDDNFECLESVFNDQSGNSREYVEQFRGRLVLFGRSGLGTRCPELPTKMPKGMSSYVRPAANWHDAMQVLDGGDLASMALEAVADSTPAAQVDVPSSGSASASEVDTESESRL